MSLEEFDEVLPLPEELGEAGFVVAGCVMELEIPWVVGEVAVVVAGVGLGPFETVSVTVAPFLAWPVTSCAMT